jgi:diguanylate cyclase (GGDEF)-like protein
MVKKLLQFSYSYPKSVLFFLVVLTMLAAPALQRLQFDISAQSLMVKSDPSWLQYEKSLQDFGSDSTIIIVLSDDELFKRDKLKKIRSALKQFKKLDFVKGTSSLFNVPNVQEVDGYVETRPFLLKLPETPEQVKTLLAQAQANPMVAGNLISADGKTMAINLQIDDTEHFAGRDREITNAIEQILRPLRQDLSEAFQMGAPYVRETISRQIEIDQRSILPAALVILIIVLGLSMGRLNCSIVPLSSATISIVLTMSFMAWMEIPVNVLTSIIPALLIIIGSTEDVHLMAEYHSGIRDGLTRDEAVQRLPVSQSMAIMLAFVTTFMGFISITVNDLELLREFGWLVSFGLTVNFLVTTLFVPAYLRLFGGTGIGLEFNRSIFQILADSIFLVVINWKKTTLFVMLLIAGYYAWGMQYLQVNNNTLAYFSEQSPVRQRAELIHQKLAGMQTFSVILDSPIEGTFKKVRYLEELDNLEHYINQLGVFDKTMSFAGFIKLTHKVMEGIDQPQLPLEDEVVGVYMEFVQFDAVSSYVNPDYSRARILVRHNIGSSVELKKQFELIRSYFKNDLKSNLKLVLTGESVLNNNAADAMARGQIQSLALMIVVIFLLVSLLFIDFSAGLIALLPNLLPIIALFGVMGYYHIPLDSGTTMVAVIALGISVDDTIHFLSRYHFFTRRSDSVEQALRKTIEHEARPITTTSIALALGFASLMLSSFQPVVYFGALSALVMVMAMFSTFVMAPVLLSFIKLVTVWDMLSLNQKADVLSKSPIFAGLKNFQIRQAILSGVIKKFPRGEVIIDQGKPGDEFFVVLEGAATATHRDDDGSIHTLAYLKPGDLFGEVAQSSQRKRMARVTADEDTQLLEMKFGDISRLGRFHPRIAMRIYRNLTTILSERIAQSSEEKDSSHDELTGALTKSYLCEIFQQEVKRSQHFAEAVSLMLLDIHIQPIEGELNSELCDAVVTSITKTIKDLLRPTDVLARWEQCSFMLLLPKSDSEQAVELAKNIEHAIDKAEITDRAHVHITAAVTQIRENDKERDAIYRLEQKLFEANRNRKSLQVSLA